MVAVTFAIMSSLEFEVRFSKKRVQCCTFLNTNESHNDFRIYDQKKFYSLRRSVEKSSKCLEPTRFSLRLMAANHALPTSVSKWPTNTFSNETKGKKGNHSTNKKHTRKKRPCVVLLEYLNAVHNLFWILVSELFLISFGTYFSYSTLNY